MSEIIRTGETVAKAGLLLIAVGIAVRWVRKTAQEEAAFEASRRVDQHEAIHPDHYGGTDE